MPEQQRMRIWTVYERPRDYPHEYVARLWLTGNDGSVTPTTQLMRSVRIESLREVLEQLGLVRIERLPDDDPVILETWL